MKAFTFKNLKRAVNGNNYKIIHHQAYLINVMFIEETRLTDITINIDGDNVHFQLNEFQLGQLQAMLAKAWENKVKSA